MYVIPLHPRVFTPIFKYSFCLASNSALILRDASGVTSIACRFPPLAVVAVAVVAVAVAVVVVVVPSRVARAVRAASAAHIARVPRARAAVDADASARSIARRIASTPRVRECAARGVDVVDGRVGRRVRV